MDTSIEITGGKNTCIDSTCSVNIEIRDDDFKKYLY